MCSKCRRPPLATKMPIRWGQLSVRYWKRIGNGSSYRVIKKYKKQRFLGTNPRSIDQPFWKLPCGIPFLVEWKRDLENQLRFTRVITEQNRRFIGNIPRSLSNLSYGIPFLDEWKKDFENRLRSAQVIVLTRSKNSIFRELLPDLSTPIPVILEPNL